MSVEKQSFRKYVELCGPMPRGRKHQRALFADVANAIGLSKRQLRKVTYTTHNATTAICNVSIDAFEVWRQNARTAIKNDVFDHILESYVDAPKEANR